MPSKLPRDHPAPVGVQLGFHAPSSATPSRIAQMSIGFPSSVTIDSDGLPACSSHRIRNLSLDRAREVCRAALVGKGSFTPRVIIPGEACFCDENGEVLAFNSTGRGRPAILLDIAIAAPIPETFQVLLREAEAIAGFPDTFTGTVPQFADGHGFLRHLNLLLRARFRIDGERRSYVSARCPAPKGFSQVNFPFARLAYTLEDGSEVASKLVRRCRVRAAAG